MGGFADVLKGLFTRGSLVQPVRLTNAMREMITTLMNEALERTSITFSEPESQPRYEMFMNAMQFLENIIKKGANRKQKMTVETANVLYYWIVVDLKYHHLSDTTDFEKATQWIMNHISKHYSVNQLSLL